MSDLYYGLPDAQHYCTYGQYPRPGTRCTKFITFYVKIPDGRGDDWRKAWASCAKHLADVIWQMQEAYGGDSLYDGDYLLRAHLWEI